MHIVHGGKMEWGANLVAHRQGKVAHKQLLAGEENSPDNYALMMAQESGEFYSPGHRHNWDQVRFCLEGSVPIGRSMKVGAGDVAYFPEGVAYGPQEGGPDRIVMVLQFGGASGQGYMSVPQMNAGLARLREQGVFEKGIFHRTSGEGHKNQDAYEAIWQEVFRQPIDYPKPCYRAPVVMRSDGFSWRPEGNSSGVRRKLLGFFPERGLGLYFIALDAGVSYQMAAEPERRLLFVATGSGRLHSEPYYAHTAASLEGNESATITAEAPTEILVISMALLGRAAA